MGEKLVFRRRKERAFRPAVLRGVYRRLRVLYTESHGKRLALQICTRGIKRFERLARGLPRGKEYRVRRDNASVCHDPGNMPVFGAKILHPGAEPYLAAERDYFFADVFDNPAQKVGADMRVGKIKYLLRRAGGDKLAQDKPSAHPLFLYERVELAVRKGARAAFAELNVGFGVQLPAAEEVFHICGAFGNRLAAFQNERAEAGPCKHQRSEHPRRAEPDHDRAQRTRRTRGRGEGIFGFARDNFAAAARGKAFFVAVNRNIHRQHIFRDALAGIQRFAAKLVFKAADRQRKYFGKALFQGKAVL